MENEYCYEGKLLKSQPECTLERILRAVDEFTTLEGICYLCDGEKNLHVKIGKYEGIIPKSECVYSAHGLPEKDIAIVTRVGKPICFKVVGVDKNGSEPIFLLSRRKAQRECAAEYISALSAGDVIEARITRLDSFGAFCDIGRGIAALLPIDRMSVSRISHPRDRFKNGQVIKAVVRESADGFGRITLTHRELLGSWEENASLFEAGQTAAGIIRSVEDYGVFIELTPNLAGLSEPFEAAEVGMSAAVYIKSIIPERMKIKLAMIDCGFGICKAPEYEYPDVTHIDSWKYSPEGCGKIIETVFNT